MKELNTYQRVMKMHQLQPWSARAEQVVEMVEQFSAAEDPAVMLVLAHYVTEDAVAAITEAMKLQNEGRSAHNFINAKRLCPSVCEADFCLP
jgi:hypothetical protein